ncbi:MAG: 16S rRNA (uracil(1498)-N(3))-methyltransferase [Syntrophobacteraceae bacterium]
MQRRRFRVDGIEAGREEVVLTGQTAHHLATVLRMGPGEQLVILDGRGREWLAEIESVARSGVRVKLLAETDASNESPLDLTLALAFARSEKMDQVVRQATELGAARVIGFRAVRSQYGLAPTDARRKRERWQKIAREALCQCRRQREPECEILSDGTELLEWADRWMPSSDGAMKILAAEAENRKSLVDLQRGSPFCMSFLAVIGPEGGWTAEETRRFRDSGFESVHLGPRILRLETAAAAVLASVQLLWGDLGVPGREAAPDEPPGEST